MWLKVSILSASALFIFSLDQLFILLLRAAVIGSQTAGGVSLYVGLILQSSTEEEEFLKITVSDCNIAFFYHIESHKGKKTINMYLTSI